MIGYFNNPMGEIKAAWREYQNIPVEIAASSVASEVSKRLESVFSDYMQTLKDNEEIGVALASFGVCRQIAVETVRAYDPNILAIDGYEDGQKVTLVQHISQLNFLLIPLPISSDAGKARRKIGFYSE